MLKYKGEFKMNKKGRLVWAILMPIISFFIALWIATKYGHNPFDLEKTWYVWMLYLIFCCIFEYKLFGDKIDK